MSRRFVAPSPEPIKINTQNITTTRVTKHGHLPPPSHPALNRQRIIFPGQETAGALNSTPTSQTQSPAPHLPHGTSFNNLRLANGPSVQHVKDFSSQNVSGISSQQIPFPTYNDESSLEQPTPASIPLSSADVSTPVLLVTPAATSYSNDISIVDGPAIWKTETVPPYSSQPDLPSQLYLPGTESLGGDDVEGSNHDNSVLNAQNQGHSTRTNTHIPPPLHPSRQPSPSPSFVNLPTLRHRGQSNPTIGDAGVSDTGASTQPTRPELSRRGTGASVLTLKDANLTDEDLRRMYDAEEMERYLRLFASRVNEVAIDPDHPDANTSVCEDEEDWISVSNPPPTRRGDPLPPHLANPHTPFEYIAALIYPYIAQSSGPQISGPKRKFKLNRAASAAKRLYLAMYPAYVPALVHLWHLSTWRDPRKSGLWCAVFWIAWAGGLLSPLIVGCLLYALITGGTVTREEIRRRRRAAKEAEKLGKAIEGGIPGVGISGELGIWEVTKLVTGIGKKRGKKVKAAAEEMKRPNDDQVEGTSPAGREAGDADDWKLTLVELAEELADLHERIKNIFLHRRPETTRTFIILLGLLFVGTLFVQNTSKIITCVIGFWFWFIPPVLNELPKLPAPFLSAPTDAEVAMELISRRVSRGERIVPARVPRRKRNKAGTGATVNTNLSAAASKSALDLTDTSLPMSPSMISLAEGSTTDDEDAEVGLVIPASETSAPQEDKLRKGAVRAWNWIGRTKQVMDQVRGVQSAGTRFASPEQSFPAHHRSGPGMLMISSTQLSFSPLFTSSTPAQSSSGTVHDTRTIKVDIEQLRGVKKVTPGGLTVRFLKGSTVVEERFLFVVGRDEAFAALVGWGGGRWKKV